MTAFLAVCCACMAALLLSIAFRAIAVRRPKVSWGLCLLLVFLAATKFRDRDPLAAVRGELDAQIVFELATYLAICLAIVAIGTTRRRDLGPREWPASLRCCAAFCLIAALSTFWSGSAALTLVRSFQLTVLFTLALMGLRLFDAEAVVRLFSRALVGYVLVASLLTVVVMATVGLERLDRTEEFALFLDHPIQLAAYSGLAALLLTAECLHAQRSTFWVLGMTVVALLLVLLLVLTRRRTPLIALLLVGAALVATRLFRVRLLRMVGLGVGLGLLVLVVVNRTALFSRWTEYAANNPTLNRFFLREQTPEQVEGLSGRVQMWAKARRTFAESPLVGHGYQGSRAQLLDIGTWVGQAHNGYLQLLLDVGMVGALLLLFPMVTGTVRLLSIAGGGQQHWWASALGGAGLFVALHSLTSPSFAGNPGPETLLAFIIANAALIDRGRG